MLQGEAPHVQEAPLQGVSEGRGRGGRAGAQGRAGEQHVCGPRVVADSVAVRHERTEAEEGGRGAGHLDGREGNREERMDLDSAVPVLSVGLVLIVLFVALVLSSLCNVSLVMTFLSVALLALSVVFSIFSTVSSQ